MPALPLFEPGRVVMSRGVATLIVDDAAGAVIKQCLDRHFDADCGDMDPDDVLANLRAIASGGERVFSSYHTQLGKLWVITEADRSSTMVLLPAEY